MMPVQSLTNTIPSEPINKASVFQKPSQPMLAHAGETLNKLTEREIQVLRFVAQGFSNKEVAQFLEISATTVGAHMNRIMSKLQLNNRTQAALFALRWGIAPLP